MQGVKNQPPAPLSVSFSPLILFPTPSIVFPSVLASVPPKDCTLRSLAPVAFPPRPGSGFHNGVITVCEKRLWGTRKRELRLKNEAPTQLCEDSVGLPGSSPLCLFLCRAKDRWGGGQRYLPGICTVSGLGFPSFGFLCFRAAPCCHFHHLLHLGQAKMSVSAYLG